MEATRKVMDLRSGEDGVNVKVRVLKVYGPKTIETRKGPRTITEAEVGDETGRVKLTVWGRNNKGARELKEGVAVVIRGAWTTSYRGSVQLNAGYNTVISRIEDDDLPPEDEIPHRSPRDLSRRRSLHSK